MKITQRHSWQVTPREAIAIQQQLRAEVVLADALGPVEYVAGIDVGFEKGNTIARAAVVVLTLPGLEVCDQAIARCTVEFPYVPGLLSFREVPVVLQALSQLRRVPDLLLCDGQGLAHPRRFGLACHLGLLTDTPAIGVAKTRLIGTHDEVPQRRGAWVPLCDGDETIGAVLRSRVNTRPLYISQGHRISLPTAVDYVMRCTPRYRLPETTRQAHRLASGH